LLIYQASAIGFKLKAFSVRSHVQQALTMEDDFNEQFRNSRPRRPTNEAAMFVENRVILSQQQPPIYAEQLDLFVPLEEGVRQRQITYVCMPIGLVFIPDSPSSAELWKSAELEKAKLFTLMQEVRIKLNKKSKNQHMHVDMRNCRWEQVLSKVKETSQIWKGLPNFSAKAQRCLERLRQDSGAFQAWLGLLPAGDYGSRYLLRNSILPIMLIASSICGAFKLAVGVSQSSSPCHSIHRDAK
jgi:hypothetical protein